MNHTLPIGFTFSQSSLQDYIDCPRRFQLRYIEGLKWPAVDTEPVMENEVQIREGQLFHRLVHQYFLGSPEEILTSLVSSANLVRWWENFVKYDFKLDGYTLFLEEALRAPIDSFWMLAKYDLVAVHPYGKVMIIDWKTNKKRLRDEWMAARIQTKVYLAMMVHAGDSLNGGRKVIPDMVQMMYWYPEYPAQPSFVTYDSQMQKSTWKGLQELVREIAHHEHFPLTSDIKKCAYCPYRSYCSRGVQAGRLEELEISEFDLDEILFDQVAEIEY
jgi:CRISPR/Cas system-associated exonuclease Cas4 (RecB family)